MTLRTTAGFGGRAGCPRRERLLRTAKLRGPDALTLASSWSVPPMVRPQARSPGSAEETVKTIARGMPDVSGMTVVTNVCATYPRTWLRTRRASGIPCGLRSHEGVRVVQKPGRFHAARMSRHISCLKLNGSLRMRRYATAPTIDTPPCPASAAAISSNECRRAP